MSQSMPTIQPVAHLSEVDQLHVQHFAQQAADWFRLFDFVGQQPYVPMSQLTPDDRLDIVFALHRMTDFADYVHPFLRNDARITAFEDAVAEAIFATVSRKAG